MSLEISKTIEFKSKKVGRNQPCPCGSGKKYKKCCLKKEFNYSPPVHKGWVTKMAGWILEKPEFEKPLTKILLEIFPKKNLEEHVLHALEEAFIYEHKIDGKTPLEHFIQKSPLSDEEKTRYQDWLERSFFSIFEVLSVDIGKSIDFKDIKDNKRYLVFEKMGTYQVEPGMIIATRLVPLDQFWMQGGGINAVLPDSAETAYSIKRYTSRLDEMISQMDFIKIFYGHNEKIISKISYEEAKNKLEAILINKQSKYRTNDFEKIIMGIAENDQNKIITEIARISSNQQEFFEISELFKNYWQAHPKFSEKKYLNGPLEEKLISAMMDESQSLELNQLPPQEANKKLQQFSQNWLNTPQVELDNQTPKETILKERISLGNPDTKLEYEFTLTPINLPDEEVELTKQYNLATKLLAKDHHYLEALKLFTDRAEKQITMLDEPFRWYSKVGTCLVNLGELELSKKYFAKSLSLSPDYQIAKDNLHNLNNKKILESQREIGKQILFISVLNDNLKLDISSHTDLSFLTDQIRFLKYLQTNTVPLSIVHRDIRFSDVLTINSLMVKPDSEFFPFGDNPVKHSREGEMFKVDFLHNFNLYAGFCQGRKGKLIITKKGEQFLNLSDSEQLTQLIILFFTKIDWRDIEGGPKKNPFAVIRMALQNQLWSILQMFKKRQTFSEKDVIQVINKGGKDERVSKMVFFALNRLFFDYLVWMNIISKNSHNYSLTNFGQEIIDQIEKQMSEAIPPILRELV